MQNQVIAGGFIMLYGQNNTPVILFDGGIVDDAVSGCSRSCFIQEPPRHFLYHAGILSKQYLLNCDIGTFSRQFYYGSCIEDFLEIS